MDGKNEMGQTEPGSTVGCFTIIPEHYAPGIWAGTEGLWIKLKSGNLSYIAQVLVVNLETRTIYTQKSAGKDDDILTRSFKIYPMYLK